MIKNFYFYSKDMEQEIHPEDLIDTTENKPVEAKEEVQEQSQKQVKQISEIPLKKISELSKEEKDVIINNAKQGVENQFYKVSFFKNGSTRITKKKQPKEQTAQKIIKQRAPVMTTEQLLMEHVIGLETQLGILHEKHKKLKGKYKKIYQDVYVDEDDVYDGDNYNNVINNTTPITNNDFTDKNDNMNANQEASQSQFMPLRKIKASGFRAKIAQRL